MDSGTIRSIDAAMPVDATTAIDRRTAPNAYAQPSAVAAGDESMQDIGTTPAADGVADELPAELLTDVAGQMLYASFVFMSQEITRLRSQTEERFRELRQDET